MFAKLLSYVVLVLMAVTWCACAQEKDVIHELKDVQFFKAQETDMTSRVNGDRFSVCPPCVGSEFPEGDVAVSLDGGSH
jgi:hypothetical protein